MEMKTHAEGKEAASSVAAKGSFARAGEENIVVAFEYQFMSAGDAGDAEIVIKLSDNQDVSLGNYEVARVRPPVAGMPGRWAAPSMPCSTFWYLTKSGQPT